MSNNAHDRDVSASIKNTMIALGQHPIAVYPAFIQIAGSLAGGVMLSQLYYWATRVHGQSFWKTDNDLRAECHLTEREFKDAKSRIKQLAFVTVERQGVPAKTWYTVDLVQMADHLGYQYEPPPQTPQSVQTSSDDGVQTGSDAPVQTGWDDGVQTISETTSETTSGTMRASAREAKSDQTAKRPKRKAEKAPRYTPEFERFWQAYPPRYGGSAKAEAARVFATLVQKGDDPEALIAAAGRFAEEMEQTERTNTSYVPMARTWLNQRRFEDYQPSDADLLAEADPQAQRWRNRLQSYCDTGGWPASWGPKPGDPECQAPAEVLQTFGYGKAGKAA